jgi:predicted DNA-binding transcriptional regulator
MSSSQSRKKQNIEEKIPFTMLPRVVLMDKKIKAGAKLVYGGIVMRACGKGRTIAGLEMIANDLGIALRTVNAHVKALETRGLIKTKRRGMGQTFIRYIVPVEEVYENPRPSLMRRQTLPALAQSSPPGNARTSPTQAQNLPIVSAKTAFTQVQNLPGISRRKEVKEEEVDEKEARCRSGNAPTTSDERLERPRPGDGANAAGGGKPGFGALPGRQRSPPLGSLEKRSGMVVGQISPKLALSADLDGAADPEDKATALNTWKEFISRVVVAYPEFTPPPKPTLKVLGMVKNLLKESSISNIRKLFDLTVKDWPAIKEKWPKLAKSIPTFYVAYTLRRDLMPRRRRPDGGT